MPDLSQTSNLRERYRALDTDRSAALIRKREHAMLTMPSLLPPSGMSSYQPLDVPYNSITAEGITFLASRIMSVVFPLNGQSVFEVLTEQQYAPEGIDTSELNAALSRFERLVMDTLAPTNLRSAINLVYQHLIAIGDCLIHMDDDFQFRIFRADQYVVRRKHEGQWMEILIEEWLNPEWYPELKRVPLTNQQTNSTQSMGNAENWEPLYTQVLRQPNGTITVTQQFRDVTVGEKIHKVSPYAPVRWGALAGEPYGISLIEHIFGDIRAVDSLSKAELDGAALNAEYRWGVNPAGLTELQDMLNSINGDFVPSAKDDVFPLQFQNHAQVQATHASVVHREQMIGRRFLMNSAVQPQGERVTARQVTILAQELESMLGGVLSQAAREIQDPIIRRAIYILGTKKIIPAEIGEQISKEGGYAKLHIRAGLEILNREAEREKLDAAIERMRNLPEQALRVFKWEEIARDWWQSMGLESDGRVKTAQELEQERAAEERRLMAQQAAAAGMQAGLQLQTGENNGAG